MNLLPLIAGGDLDAPLAWAAGRPISRRRYLADVARLAEQLPPKGYMLNLSADRYRFAVGLGAALLRGHANLMPPNHTTDTVARLEGLFPGMYMIDDPTDAQGRPGVQWSVVWPAHAACDRDAPQDALQVETEQVAAQVLTSGSTGDPVPHTKAWGGLWLNAQAGAERLAEHLGRARMEGVNLVATVPAQHMYGFESSVLLAMLGGAAFDVGRPFYPADIAAALARLPRPRMLVTTPLHLKTLLDSGTELPPLDLIVCATAPLSPQLATRAEVALAAPLMEIYGCTEAGQVATRRTTLSAQWHTFNGITIEVQGPDAFACGGHVAQRTALADTLEVETPTCFRLLARSNDLVNIAGKRSSLTHLNHHLNSIVGVQDGAFWLPEQASLDEGEVMRMVAFVVAPGLSRERILGALKQRIDAAFVPRRVIWVDALPRDPTGKLPSQRLAVLAQKLLASRQVDAAD